MYDAKLMTRSYTITEDYLLVVGQELYLGRWPGEITRKVNENTGDLDQPWQ